MAESLLMPREQHEKLMVLCECSDIEQWSTTALRMIMGYDMYYKKWEWEFTKLKGKPQIMKRASLFPKGSEMRNILEGLAKTDDKFSYYFEFTDPHDYRTKVTPTLGYDLIKGRRIY